MRLFALLLAGLALLSVACGNDADDNPDASSDASIKPNGTPSLKLSVKSSEATAKATVVDGGTSFVLATFDVTASSEYADGVILAECLDGVGNALTDWQFTTPFVDSGRAPATFSARQGMAALRHEQPIAAGTYAFTLVATAGSLKQTQALTVVVP